MQLVNASLSTLVSQLKPKNLFNYTSESFNRSVQLMLGKDDYPCSFQILLKI